MDLIREPWPWYVAGPLIGLVVPMVFLVAGRKWGLSSTFRDACAAVMPSGLDYFRYDWKSAGGWRLSMAAGLVVGALVATTVLAGSGADVAISEATRADLAALGITDFSGLAPEQVFSWAGLLTPAGVLMIVGGGFLVGFGTRYADGCTSGHAISGMSMLQATSLAAVLGFFAGGLLATHVLLPALLGGTS